MDMSDSMSDTSENDENDADYEIPYLRVRTRGLDKIITINLICPVESCGSIVIDKDELDEHLLEVHQVQKHRCLAMGCTASFENL